MKRIYLILTILIVSALVLVGCSGGADDANGADSANGEELVLTVEELAQYDGKDGNPAYVAVDGIIYDVTESDLWDQGEHNGFEAGMDLTEGIKDVSPHGVSVLERMPVVGEIAD